MNQSSTENLCYIYMAIDFGAFHNETTTDGRLCDGQLIIDITPSIFVIDPDLLVDEETIILSATDGWNLTGKVARTGLPPTAITNYRVTSKMVPCSYQSNSEQMLPSVTLGFDPKTGVLTEAAGDLRDILLRKMSINFILGGIFGLISYSDNLNFDLVLDSSISWNIFLIIIPVATFSLITILAYNSLKKKGLRHVK